MTWLLTLFVVLITITALIALYVFVFLRSPRRTPPDDARAIVSPADGKVAAIIPYDGERIHLRKGVLGHIRAVTHDVAAKGTIVVIALRLWDVHFQRSPITGTIEYTHHTPGLFRNAVLKAHTLRGLENERNEILITSKRLRCKVVQVAGLIARRIHCFVGADEPIERASLLGLISLGSQVLLILPASVEITAVPGAHVRAGESVLGVYR